MSEQPEQLAAEQNTSEQNQPQSPDLHQLVDKLMALDNLVQVAISNIGARNEARHQLGQLAETTQTLIQTLPTTPEYASIIGKLNEFIANIPPDPLIEWSENEVKNLEVPQSNPELQEKLRMEKRLSNFLDRNYDTSDEEDSADLGETERRRVVVASLESGETNMRATVEVSRSFDALRWQVTNLGASTPIMALTSIIKEVKPAVVILVIHKGNMLVETRRLIADLHKSLYGLKVIVAGPVFEEQPDLSNTLNANAYETKLNQVAKLASYLLSPIKNLEEPLELEHLEVFDIEPTEQIDLTEETVELDTPEKTEDSIETQKKEL